MKLIKEDYTQFFEQSKEHKKERFKELKKKKAIKINQLLNAKTLGKEPYQRLATLM